ncbi:hypothetical protein DFH01_02700 [Falsiroseomonas bella]|uniref:Uncharacterized protein n=1 Tax=Falsiroseomonas bella TaxID=2184016 RepID=A0A317FKV8_9PROT|nr:hypothetical protein [Falsiroseomonas bella]PWS38226.1 hypothetical protein DFH01_02700 [Falsiroseomonas bella]
MQEKDVLAAAVGLGAPWPARDGEIAEAIATARKTIGGFTRPADEKAEPLPAFVVPAAKEPRR